MSDQSDSGDTVDVIVPLTPRHASTLRTMSASFGADARFSIDEIDDFKLALTEVFSILVTQHAGRRARASFAVADSSLSVRLSLESGAGISFEPDELALAILRAVVDSYEVGTTAIKLTKAATETSLLGS